MIRHHTRGGGWQGKQDLNVGGRTGGGGKEGFNIKGGTEIGNPILIRGGNVHKTYLEMVGRLAQKFTSILNHLIVTFK